MAKMITEYVTEFIPQGGQAMAVVKRKKYVFINVIQLKACVILGLGLGHESDVPPPPSLQQLEFAAPQHPI